MAMVRDIKAKSADALYMELVEMKNRIGAMKAEFEGIYGAGTGLGALHARHLVELADIVDWKLHILSTAAPGGTLGPGEAAETVVSVRQADLAGPDFSGGYVGG